MKKKVFYISVSILVLVGLITILMYNKKANINKVYDSVVYIESIDEETVTSGSGFIYKVEDNKNYIVTCYHVIEGYTDVYVYNNNKEKVKANILNYDEYTDIAVLTIEDSLGLKEISIGDSTKSNVDDEIYVVGTPIEISNINTISDGIINAIDKEITITTTHGTSNLKSIAVSAKVDYGNSGGPLLNKNNEVIGMMFVKELDEISFALPINFVMDIVNKLENNELNRPSLGAVMCNTTNTELLNEYNIKIDNVNGVVLIKVNKDHSLYKAGLQKGDIITKLDDKEVGNVNELREELYRKEVGDSTSIEYYRNGTYYGVDIEL